MQFYTLSCIPFFAICFAGTSGKRSSSSALTHFYWVSQYPHPKHPLLLSWGCGTPSTIFPGFPSSFFSHTSAFITQWVTLHFSYINSWLFSCGFLLYFWENICFSMMLLKRVTSLLQLTVCREECASVRVDLERKMESSTKVEVWE